jgi:hypothetical protein
VRKVPKEQQVLKGRKVSPVQRDPLVHKGTQDLKELRAPLDLRAFKVRKAYRVRKALKV